MNLKQVTEVESNKDALSEAIKRRDWKIICDAISEESISLDCLSPRQVQSLLRFSVKFNNICVVEKLIDEKIVNINPHAASSLLWVAVKSGHTEIGSKLVRLGADLNRRRRGCTFLHKLAIKSNQPKNAELAILMLDYGADMNALHGLYHKCAFSYAIRRNCKILVKELLNRGALIRYYLLQKTYRYDVIPHLFDIALNIFVDGEIKEKRPVSLLWDLIRLRDGSAVSKKFEEVLALGLITVDELKKNSQIFVKLLNGQCFKMVRRLIEYGFDFDLKKYEIQTGLDFAAMYHRSDITEWLIRKGANVNVCCVKTRRYALHTACSNSSEANVKLLLEHGANINIRHKYGLSPDYYIYEEVGLDVIKHVALLVSRGAAVHESYFKKINFVPDTQTVYNNYLNELRKLKSTYVFFNISLFSVLTDIKTASFSLRNPACIKNFQDLKLEASFPLFHQDVDAAFNKAVDRKNALAYQENEFYEVVCDILPHLVIEKIMLYFYLTDIDY